MFDLIAQQLIDLVREERIVREEQSETVSSLTYRVFHSLAELARLPHHRRNVQIYLQDSAGDIGRMSYWSSRMNNIERGMALHAGRVNKLYPRLVELILDKSTRGEPLTDLDIFLIKLKPHLTDLLQGKKTIYQLDRSFNWEKLCFTDESGKPGTGAPTGADPGNQD